MNAHVGSHATTGAAARTQNGAAIVTPSYAADFERCKLLCETMDRYVSGCSHHYILVEQRDVPRFRELESAHRTVIDERDILPSWLKAYDEPFSRRRVWLGWGMKPMRGWHVQQFRRIAIAHHVRQDVLVYCDSDVIFLKPFDLGLFQQGDRVRLFRQDDVLLSRPLTDHLEWIRNSAIDLGLPPDKPMNNDYITTVIAWRRQSVVDMCDHIEKTTGRHWVRALGRTRKFSECMIYGRYVDEVTASAHHFHGAEEFCRVQWVGEEMSDALVDQFIESMSPEQTAICIQSYVKIDVAHLRRVLGTV